jgi:hypothetical protein
MRLNKHIVFMSLLLVGYVSVAFVIVRCADTETAYQNLYWIGAVHFKYLLFIYSLFNFLIWASGLSKIPVPVWAALLSAAVGASAELSMMAIFSPTPPASLPGILFWPAVCFAALLVVHRVTRPYKRQL